MVFDVNLPQFFQKLFKDIFWRITKKWFEKGNIIAKFLLLNTGNTFWRGHSIIKLSQNNRNLDPSCSNLFDFGHPLPRTFKNLQQPPRPPPSTSSCNQHLQITQIKMILSVSVLIINQFVPPTFCLCFTFTGINFWGMSHHVSDVAYDKNMCGPIIGAQIDWLTICY